VLAIVGSLRSAVADWNDVPTGSMKPTILEGERIFVNKLAYDLKLPFTRWHLAVWGEPQRGDVVVLFSPADGRRLVKRVIGLPGDRIAMVDNRLVINGVPAGYDAIDAEAAHRLIIDSGGGSMVEREHLDSMTHSVLFEEGFSPARSFRTVVIPAGHYFVMGDNRDNSFDSRWFGFVERDSIVGRATAVVASLDTHHFWRPRWHRFLRGLT
jgi:signal peptidase I